MTFKSFHLEHSQTTRFHPTHVDHSPSFTIHVALHLLLHFILHLIFFFIILLPQDLIETNQYTFRVYAENAAGPGKPSEPLGPIIAKDPFDKPGKPGQPEVTEVVADSATLAWAEPRDDGDSPITNYIVEMKRAGDFTWTNVSRYERYERNKCLR